MKYLMIIMFLTSCNTNLKDTYENSKYFLENGMYLNKEYRFKKKNKYIYIQKNNSNTKYGYDYKTSHIRIKFKTKF